VLNISKTLRNIFDWCKNMVGTVWEIVLDFFNKIIEVINSVIDVFIWIFDMISDALSQLSTSIQSDIIQGMQTPTVPDFFQDSLNMLNAFFPVNTFISLIYVMISLFIALSIFKLVVYVKKAIFV
jgi:phage-related protein